MTPQVPTPISDALLAHLRSLPVDDRQRLATWLLDDPCDGTEPEEIDLSRTDELEGETFRDLARTVL